MAAISFQQVEKTYASGVHALGGVSFDVEPGEFFGLLGPNGAGKTSLISILAGLSQASGGTVEVMGHDVVSDYAAARSRIVGDDIVPEHQHPAAGCPRQAREDADQCRLTRPVRPEQAEELAGLDVEAHIIERLDGAASAAVRLADVLE